MVSTMKHLEDYVSAMENRSEGMDVHDELRQKEKDLMLAAELGKALLDKNEDLSRQNERITEEYTQRLEVLEQEKYQLRRKLDAAITDYEIRVGELQADVAELQKSLEEQQRLMKQSDRDHTLILNELTEQNQRLTTQLKEATKKEESLQAQLQGLRDQFSLRKMAMSDHSSHLESLRDEISIITAKKYDLEKKIDMILAEKEGLSHHLDDSSDRILLLERQNREQEMQLVQYRSEVDEIKAANHSLSTRLELLNRSATVNRSLLNELELSADFRTTSGLSAASSGIGAEEDEIECDEPLPTSSAHVKELKEEIWMAYLSILSMCNQLKGAKSKTRVDDGTSSMETSLNDSSAAIKPGILSSSVEELKLLLRELANVDGMQTGAFSNNSQLELEMRLHSADESVNKMERVLAEKSDENKRLKDHATQLASQITIREAELAAAIEERDNARLDLSQTHLAKDEIVKKAWDLRDQAVQRKNKAEIAMARTRIEMMQVDSQLMEAIQQKIQLSQQLEQWQVDMQQLLDEQMRTKLSKQETKDQPPKVVTESVPSTSQIEKKRNKLLAIFRNFNGSSSS
ncbi:bicaudal D-related protein homolog [Folsomia candida]|uniref:Bicaudal D-related protein n=1 Tax=Folsomia candida TaxID=158441 RepID=A0A226E820_FOLCA|nr:bicaudal D-related protein homolog [Folsomia candida]OXA52806.1 Bicaudal D-related protein [Folsomia candida]